ncbi:MAG TPA: hypothetical protein VL728_02800 [Cyclobacteriaceae bacterium]|jgi:hypothetical protein|nr:hypothetical protein [Cyclobacteriaceae bacterium]
MKCFSLLCTLMVSVCLHGQYYRKPLQPDTSHYKQICLTLSPIVVENGKYYFNEKRVKYEEIVLPLMSVNDRIINKKVKTVRTMRELFKPIFIAETLYLINAQLNCPYTQREFQRIAYAYIGILVFNELYHLSITVVKRKTVARYNDLVMQPLAAISPAMGLSIGCKLRF